MKTKYQQLIIHCYNLISNNTRMQLIDKQQRQSNSLQITILNKYTPTKKLSFSCRNSDNTVHDYHSGSRPACHRAKVDICQLLNEDKVHRCRDNQQLGTQRSQIPFTESNIISSGDQIISLLQLHKLKVVKSQISSPLG